jgi:hypothetical protein
LIDGGIDHWREPAVPDLWDRALSPSAYREGLATLVLSGRVLHWAFERLERCALKDARTVLWGGKPVRAYLSRPSSRTLKFEQKFGLGSEKRDREQ